MSEKQESSRANELPSDSKLFNLFFLYEPSKKNRENFEKKLFYFQFIFY